MYIKQFVWDVVDSNSWLIVENNCGLLIDVIDSQEMYDDVLNLKNLMIILTHRHFDHIIGLNKLCEIRHDLIVIASEKCSENIGNKYRNMSDTANAFMKFYDGGLRDN